MNISSTNGTSSATGTSTTTNTATGLNADSFLTLLIAELKTQDPMNPMDSQAMVAQLSTMEMVSESRVARQSQQMVEALGMMGRNIVWQDTDTGQYYNSVVTGVGRNGSDPVVFIDHTDRELKLDQIVAISESP